MITIENLSFTYPKADRPALQNMSIRFETGLVNVLIGLNGAGKTTLFDIISGLYKPQHGHITNLPHIQDMLYQIQGTFLSALVKGKEYIRLIYNISGKKFINDENYIIEQMNLKSDREKELLKDLWNKKIGQMSVGERRWLYVITLTQLKRSLYIFDEPTSGVDPSSRIKIYKRIEELSQMEGNVIILSTHHLHDLKFITCKINVLHKGSILFEGDYQSFISLYGSENPDIAFDNCINNLNQEVITEAQVYA
ncbi:ATP-binding cassette domain-containing protein [Brevibacillus daliensis]|uniref:ATP-binding cassette domain-containing protein n=1 Tax=Brevibacillus daliensis TaxID=2892995 RepID=UPI001E2A868D|nr:ABC transporter ATP-binding protein [Brevibacillus daliensis]